jgi:hypothetical protein
MQKAGSIIALIASILSLLVLTAEAVLVMVPQAFSDADRPIVIGYVMGWAFMVSIVIALSITALKTTRRWPKIALVIWSMYTFFTFGIDFWIVSFYLFFAVIGGIMSLDSNRRWWALIFVLWTVFAIMILPFEPPLPYVPVLPSIMSQFWQGFVDAFYRRIAES